MAEDLPRPEADVLPLLGDDLSPLADDLSPLADDPSLPDGVHLTPQGGVHLTLPEEEDPHHLEGGDLSHPDVGRPPLEGAFPDLPEDGPLSHPADRLNHLTGLPSHPADRPSHPAGRLNHPAGRPSHLADRLNHLDEMDLNPRGILLNPQDLEDPSRQERDLSPQEALNRHQNGPEKTTKRKHLRRWGMKGRRNTIRQMIRKKLRTTLNKMTLMLLK